MTKFTEEDAALLDELGVEAEIKKKSSLSANCLLYTSPSPRD